MFMMGNKRMIGFTPTDEYFAKGCFGVRGVMQLPELKPGQKSTFLTDLFRKAQEDINAQAEIYSGEKTAYDVAMQEGRAFIALVGDPDTALKAREGLAKIHHALTSAAELGAEFKRKCKKLGLKYDKEKNAYVLADTKPAEQLEALS